MFIEIINEIKYLKLVHNQDFNQRLKRKDLLFQVYLKYCIQKYETKKEKTKKNSKWERYSNKSIVNNRDNKTPQNKFQTQLNYNTLTQNNKKSNPMVIWIA